MHRWGAAFLTGACIAVALAGCAPGTVRVSYRPPVGARYRHEVRVHSVTTIRLAGSPAEETVDDALLLTEDTVLAAGADQVRVQVRVRQAGQADRTFIVRLDRAAQLAGVEAIEGLPPTVLEPGALPRIVPGAPGAPPDRPLAPGDRWTIDAPAGTHGNAGARVVGSGRLVELGVLDGRKVASTRARTRVPLTNTSRLRGSTLFLDGAEITEGTATRTLVDGAIERATTLTRGEFRVRLVPSDDAQAVPVDGTLSIQVETETRRLRP